MDRFRRADSKDVEKIVSFIKSYVKKSGCSGVVLGISGGLDSAVAAKLSAEALGPENVLGILMPCGTLEGDVAVAKKFSESLKIRTETVDIEKAVDSLAPGKKRTPLERGNLSARIRMAVLYDFAKSENHLVLGTSNLSEISVGYFTKYGDAGCDLMPLAGYYKTQIYQLAELIGIPEYIISKPPSAGFWEGQTDESELKMPYETLDEVLFLLSLGKTADSVSAELGIPSSDVCEIKSRMENSEHKRKMPAKP